MRISSRGTISGGPVFWILFTFIIGPFILGYYLLKVLIRLVLFITMEIDGWRDRRVSSGTRGTRQLRRS